MKNSITGTLAALIVVTMLMIVSSPAEAAGMVASITKAPVIADGNVKRKPTDYVITFDGSLDPAVPGRTLAAGNIIKVIFPPEFDLSDIDTMYPLHDAPTPLPPVMPLDANQCVPAYLTCTTAVILRGWPQDPYFPPALFHTLSIDTAENALIFTAVQDMGPTGPENPGIKQLHLILNGVRNPGFGLYQIRVEAQTGPGGAWEYGSGILGVINKTRPSINVTSVLVKALSGQLEGGPACGPGTNPPNADNPIYQTTAAGTAAPFPWTFLLWGWNNKPLTDGSLEWISANQAILKSRKRTVGFLFIDAPVGATGYGINVNPLNCPTLMGGAPVIAATPGIGPQPVGRLDMSFQTGDMPGTYTTTIVMKGGNVVQMFVTAE